MTYSRALIVSSAIVLGASAARLKPHSQGQDDRSAIQAVLDAQGDAWTRGDAHAAAAVVTEDADWVSGSGHVFEGRPAIEAMHRQDLAEAKGSRHSHPGTPKFRFIPPDVAIVDGHSYMAGLRDEQGRELPPHFSRYTAVFVKNNGVWKVTAFRSLPQLKSKLTPADVPRL